MSQRCGVAAVVLGLVLATPVAARESWIGRWAAQAGDCHGNARAVLVATPTTLRWFAAACTIGRMYRVGPTVYIDAHCAGADRRMRVPVTLQRNGEGLGVRWNGLHTTLVRCR